MMKLKKIIGFLVTMLFVVIAVPTMASAAEQYTGNLIPAMTSNTSPSGVAKASSEKSSTEAAYKAFDHLSTGTGTYWYTSTLGSAWLEYDFVVAKKITKYALLTDDNMTTVLPKSWTFEAWDSTQNKWIVLDTQSNISWTKNERKEFMFQNTNPYNNYRINVASSYYSDYPICIRELEMMETISPQVSAPTNLTATAGDTIVNLKWDAVTGATSYNVKRSDTAGGPYVTIASVSGSAITYADKNVINGKTYYYVVTAVTANGESSNSNEASATPASTSSIAGNKAILVISFNNGKEKEYDLTATEIDKFVSWYDAKADGTGKSYFKMPKHSNVKPFISRNEFIKFENIESFEIKDYNDVQ